MTSTDARTSDEDLHAADAHHVGGGHEHEHASGHDHDEEHPAEHAGEPLGPIDWGAWGAAVAGVAVAALIAASLAVAAYGA
jgi:hypothetical protein